MREILYGLAAAALATGTLAVPATAFADTAYAPHAQAAAIVNADGSIVRSTGVEGVTKTGDGRYCVRLAEGINAAVSVPFATISEGSTWDANVFVANNGSGCGDPARNVQVFTARYSTASFTDEPFRVVVP